MEPQNPPSKIARLADHATSRTSCDNHGLEMRSKWGSSGGEGSPPTGLGLSLKLGRRCGSGNRQGCSKSSGFTFLQLQELEHQALIYNYIEAGLPVPHHLVLPIWKSVAGSLSSVKVNGIGLHQQCFPNLVVVMGMGMGMGMGHSPLYNNDYKSSMEAEAGRCRRTDGKKWRCSKDVAANHKYCERHMHRGRRHRSRKHVEAPQPQPQPQLLTSTSTDVLLHISCPN